MRRRLAWLLVGAAVTAASAGAAAAFPGAITLFSDPAGQSCMAFDYQPGLITLYIIHSHTSGATASQFRVAEGDGFTGVFVSAEPALGFLAVGVPTDDYAVSYAGCTTGTFLVATLTYLGLGTSQACSEIEINPAPSSPIPGEIVEVTCTFEFVANWSIGPLVVNYDAASCYAWCIGATEASTWGRIKALYR